jgi:PKD repeat protein
VPFGENDGKVGPLITLDDAQKGREPYRVEKRQLTEGGPMRTTPIRQRGLLVRPVSALFLGLGGLVATVGLLGVAPAQANTGLTAGPSQTIDRTEGVNTGSVELGTFTDSNPTAPVSDFTASVNWGDGSAIDTGTISQPGGVGTAFVVLDSHTYVVAGTFTASVAVSGDGGTVTLLATVNVADPLTAGPSLLIDATEGTSTGTIEVGTFTDSNPTAPVSDFTASIDWGDGTSTEGTISQPGGVGTAFVVTGSHTYFAPGTFTPNIDVSGDGGTVTLLATVKVASPCASGTAYFLTATSRTGNFTGVFCANGSGTGPYTQSGGATGTGTLKLSGSTIWISASGKNLALLGEKSSAVNTFTETAPGPMKAGTFTLVS